MDVVILLVFVSLMLVAAGLAFFLFRLREGDFDHGDRLALKPLSDDEGFEDASRGTSEDDRRASERLEGGTLHVGS